MSKTESEAARVLRHLLTAKLKRTYGINSYDYSAATFDGNEVLDALAAIEREDAERAIAWDGITDDTDAIKAATDDGPGYWTPPDGVVVPEWAGVVAWSRSGYIFAYSGTAEPERDARGVLNNTARLCRHLPGRDVALAGQWRLIRREPEPAADEVARLRAVATALDEALAVGPQTTLDSYESPREAIRDLLKREVAVALDPRVSEQARDLIARAEKVAEEAVNRAEALEADNTRLRDSQQSGLSMAQANVRADAEVARLREELEKARDYIDEMEHRCDGYGAITAEREAECDSLREELAEARELAWEQAKETARWKADRDAWLRETILRGQRIDRLEARLARIAQEVES